MKGVPIWHAFLVEIIGIERVCSARVNPARGSSHAAKSTFNKTCLQTERTQATLVRNLFTSHFCQILPFRLPNIITLYLSYLLALQPVPWLCSICIPPQKGHTLRCTLFGGDNRDRTDGLRVANATLYQLSHIPVLTTLNLALQQPKPKHSRQRHLLFEQLHLPMLRRFAPSIV